MPTTAYLEPIAANACTTITYQLASEGPVQITVFDTLGQQVKSLVSSLQSSGRHQTSWDGRNNYGRALRSGLYLVNLKDFNGIQTTRTLRLP